MIEDRGKTSLQLPGREEVSPVDELRELGQRHVVEIPPPHECRRRGFALVPVVLQAIRARLFVGHERLLASALVPLTDIVLVLAVAAVERASPLAAEEA